LLRRAHESCRQVSRAMGGALAVEDGVRENARDGEGGSDCGRREGVMRTLSIGLTRPLSSRAALKPMSKP
jgi:hypothetical protein